MLLQVHVMIGLRWYAGGDPAKLRQLYQQLYPEMR